jgi:ribosomal protein L29
LRSIEIIRPRNGDKIVFADGVGTVYSPPLPIGGDKNKTTGIVRIGSEDFLLTVSAEAFVEVLKDPKQLEANVKAIEKLQAELVEARVEHAEAEKRADGERSKRWAIEEEVKALKAEIEKLKAQAASGGLAIVDGQGGEVSVAKGNGWLSKLGGGK